MFFIFLFIFALTFHKCQIVMKAILSFLIFGPFFVVFFYFSFHFCFDLPQVSNCYESDSFIFLFFDFFFFFIFALTFHKCQFVKKAFLFIFIFLAFFKVGPFFVFFGRFRFRFFGVF